MHWVLLAMALACAGFFQGVSRLGFGLVSMSLTPFFMGIKQAAVISTVFSLLATATERVSRDRAIFMPHALLLGSEADMHMLADAFAKVYEHRLELVQRRRATS